MKIYFEFVQYKNKMDTKQKTTGDNIYDSPEIVDNDERNMSEDILSEKLGIQSKIDEFDDNDKQNVLEDIMIQSKIDEIDNTMNYSEQEILQKHMEKRRKLMEQQKNGADSEIIASEIAKQKLKKPAESTGDSFEKKIEKQYGISDEKIDKKMNDAQNILHKLQNSKSLKDNKVKPEFKPLGLDHKPLIIPEPDDYPIDINSAFPEPDDQQDSEPIDVNNRSKVTTINIENVENLTINLTINLQ